jgi:hypothetical protein
MVLTCLVVGALVNLAQFPGIDATAPARFRAVQTSRSPDLLRIAGSFPLVRFRYEVALALRAAAPGSTLIVPSAGDFPGRELVAQVQAFGGVTRVRPLPYDPGALAPGLDLKRHVIARSARKRRPRRSYLKRKFLLLAQSSTKSKKGPARTDAREFIVLERGGDVVIADTALVSSELEALGT